HRDVLVLVLLQRRQEQLLLVPEGPVQAAAVQAHLRQQLGDAGGVVAVFPERLHRLLGGRIGIEFLGSWHTSEPASVGVLECSVKNRRKLSQSNSISPLARQQVN